MKPMLRVVLTAMLLLTATLSAFAQRPRQPLSDEAQQQVEVRCPTRRRLMPSRRASC